MMNRYFRVLVITFLLASFVSAHTDHRDVQVLRALFMSLNSPTQLIHWRSDGGDPCSDSWAGVFCSDSSVNDITLQALNLSGTLGHSLSALHNLVKLDVSSNSIGGDVPHDFPPKLLHLNLSHNSLSGFSPDGFTGLESVVRMDLAYNNFTGNLPSSFSTLKHLARLSYARHIQDNDFDGTIPWPLRSIQDLLYGGNRLELSSENHDWRDLFGELRVVVHTIIGVFLACAVFLIVSLCHRRLARPIRWAFHKWLQHTIPTKGPEVVHPENQGFHTGRECPSGYSPTAPAFPNSGSSSQNPSINISRELEMTPGRANQQRKPIGPIPKLYSLNELRSAKNSYIGEGSLGSVYKAEFPDGEICAVKHISTRLLSETEELQFENVVWNASSFTHSNIVNLRGYCVEDGRHIIVYKYISDCSLENVLHCAKKPHLSWVIRLKVALDISQALSYLHHTVVPAVAHGNLKAANILLGSDLTTALVSDSGLAVLKPLISPSLNFKASKIAIHNSEYIAPQHVPGSGSIKGDVYAFGVLLLELFTGRMPFDRFRPAEEQSMVKWASLKLHDNDSLQQIVDPNIRSQILPRSLSRFAGIVSRCIQHEDLRPLMSEMMDALKVIHDEELRHLRVRPIGCGSFRRSVRPRR